MSLVKNEQDENNTKTRDSVRMGPDLHCHNQKPTSSTMKYQQDNCSCDKVRKTSQKRTYSAQHQTHHLARQQVFAAKANNRSNIGSTGYTSSNVFPMYNIPSIHSIVYQRKNLRPERTVPSYNVSSVRVNQKTNARHEHKLPNGQVQYSCPCSALPPPMPPPRDDLWDLQFCRWWGWNWVRKREEMLNNKREDIKVKGKDSNTSVNKKQGRRSKRNPRKQNDVRTWLRKLFNKPKRNSKLKPDEKKQLQDLYDTPCSSIMFNSKCPCQINDWECRSIKLQGDYECYCSSSGKSSLSTVLVRNKTRRQAYKQNKRKHQPWVLDKSDTSSSEECCRCMNICPYKGESGSDESVEYLSLRLAQLKSDSDDNFEFYPCFKLKGCKKNCQKLYKIPKKDVHGGCPCRIRFVGEKYNKPRKQRQNSKEPKQRRHCECQNKSPSPCRSLPVCRTSSPVKVPQLRKSSPTECVQSADQPFPEFRRCLKRKYIPECSNKGNKELILYCPCQLYPKKRIKKSKNEKKVYHCCCCCCHCCCRENKNVQPENQSESTENSKLEKLKDEDTKQNAEANNQSTVKNMLSFPLGYFQENPENVTQTFVSKAFDNGFYVSPLTGKKYTLHPQFFSINEITKQRNLPKPMNLKEEIFTFNFSNSPLIDEEHKSLLSAVCEAILSSRAVNKKPTRSQSEISHSKDLSGNFNLGSIAKHRPSTVFRARNGYRNCEYLDSRFSEEIKTNNYESDHPENSYHSKMDTKKATPRNLISSPFDEQFAISNNSNNQKTDEISKLKYDIFLNDSNNFNFNVSNYASTSKNKSDPLQHNNKCFPRLTSTELHPATSSNSFKTRIPIRRGNLNISQKSLTAEEKLLNLRNSLLQKKPALDIAKNNNTNANMKSLQDLKQKGNENGLINLPFNSPQNWITPPTPLGVSLTGLFSSVGATKNSEGYNFTQNKRPNSTKQTKRRRIYNVFFANDKPGPSKDFANVPVKFNPIANTVSNCPLILQELPVSDVTHATQTNVNTSIEITDNESETELQCVNLDKVQSYRKNATNTIKNVCTKAQKPIRPMHAGVNTMISSVKDTVFISDETQPGNVVQNTSSFSKEHFEKEIGYVDCNEDVSKNMLDHTRNSTTEVKNIESTSTCLFLRYLQRNKKAKDTESIPESACLFLDAPSRGFQFVANPSPLTKDKPENITSTINRIPEETVEDITSKTDFQTPGWFSEASTSSYLRDENKDSNENSSLASGPQAERFTQFELNKPHMYTSGTSPQTVDASTSPLQFHYIAAQKDDRSASDIYKRNRLAKRESPFSMFCKPVLPKKVKTIQLDRSSDSNNYVSRPERKMVVKSLKEREKRWRY